MKTALREDKAALGAARSVSWMSEVSRKTALSEGRTAPAAASEQDMAGFNIANEPVPRHSNSALNQFMAEQGNERGMNEASWKTALSENEGSIIEMAEVENVTLYRGMNKGKNPYETGGHGQELGPGIYFTDSLELARAYATTQYEPSYSKVQGEVYKYEFRGSEWRDYRKHWTKKDGGTVKHVIDLDKFRIIKTGHRSTNQYRFSPEVAKIMRMRGVLVKIEDV